MTIKIAGKVWRIHRRVRPGNSHERGNVVYPRRTMYLAPGQTGKELMDTVIHEGLHAAFPDLDEEVVRDRATELTRLLWRLGFRDTDVK